MLVQLQGLLFEEGGGEKNGKVVGILTGIEGKFGSEVAAGSGGRESCGAFGMVGIEGRDGCGSDGMVGKGGTFP